MIRIELRGKENRFETKDELDSFLLQNGLKVNFEGSIVEITGAGVIPEILEKWFSERMQYKNMMKKYVNEGNKELAEYYDRRQHIQKIFLNSLYGVLGLPVFRFYDVDNAAAVTLSGQDVIKTSSKFVNMKYEKFTGDKKDHCVYVDTDSLYFPAGPLVSEAEDTLAATINLANDIEKELNRFYNTMAKKLFNVTEHRFHIKGESVAKTGFWVAKKRYALDKVYDLETNQPVNKMVVKGLDVVRSSFPKAFREFMTQLLKDILKRVPKERIDENILELKESLKHKHYLEIARNTSANNITEYTAAVDAGDSLNKFKKGTPVHIKAAIVYNRLLEKYDIAHKFEPITNGSKIKYVYLKNNPLQIEAIAIKGHQDPPQIIEMVEQDIDTNALFENELRNKLDDFYSALNWGNIPTEVNQNATEWFAF